MNIGAYCPLESTIPPITVPAWMCMMTGRDPGSLGIYGFRNRSDRGYAALSFANNRMVREDAIWDVLGRAGKKSILLGVPLTYPPKPINGLLVSDFLAPDTSVDYTYPPELKREVEDLVGDYILDVRSFRTNDKERLLREIREMTAQRFQLARHLVTNHPWDLFAMVEMGPDRMHHGFWRYFDPQHRLHEPGHPLEHALFDYYLELDHHIGELLDSLPSEAAVMVVSDHGAKRMDGAVCLNDWLMQEGYLTLKEPLPVGEVVPFKPDLVDWSSTRAWGDGGYYGRVFLNVAGREPQGIVSAAEAEELKRELSQKLEALPDDQGKPLGSKVFLPEQTYRAVNGVPPDMIVYFGDLHWRSVGSVGHPSVWIHENDTGPDDANHAQFGICILPPAMSGGKLGLGPSRTIYDIAPLILRHFGLEPPPGMGSASVTVGDESVYTAEEEAEIARRLEELGYL